MNAFTNLLCVLSLTTFCVACTKLDPNLSGNISSPAGFGSDATLSSLFVSGVTLSPVFSSTTTSYTGTTPYATESVVVTAITRNSNADLTINGGNDDTITLALGDNIISISVLAENGTTRSTYTVVVTRTPVIDTTGDWDRETNEAPFGDGDASEVFGQTFVVAVDLPTLRSLSFWLQHSDNDTSGEDLTFSVVVMAWSTDRATGPVLYESALQRITTAQSMMTEYQVNTGGLILSPGQKYVAFLSAINGFWNVTSTPIRVGFVGRDVYADGETWILNTDIDPGLITSAAWDNSKTGTSDLAVIFAF